MTTEQENNLIKIIKEKCYISSDDKSIESRLKNIIEDAIIKVSDLIGFSEEQKESFDFSSPSLERDLLKNYCWYSWNDHESEFKNNYADDIMVLRTKYEVKNELKENQ